jgi:hypothetical protein
VAKGEAQVPDPLTRDLPKFLSILGVRAPPIGIFFDIFVREHSLKGSPSMGEIHHILDQKPLRIKGRQEQFIDPLSDELAHPDRLVWGRSEMPSHNHPNGRQFLTQC